VLQIKNQMLSRNTTHLKVPKLPEKYAGCHQHYYTWWPHWHGGVVHDDVLPFGENWGNHDAPQATSLAEGNFCNVQVKNLNTSIKILLQACFYMQLLTLQLYCL
jgi:hypothetical protein